MASAPADRHGREAARAPVESASTPPSPRLPFACDSGSVAVGEAVAPSGKARRKDSAAARRQRRIRSEARLRLQLTRDGALLASHRGGPQPGSQPEVSLLRAEVALLRAEICYLRAAGSQVPSFRIAEPGEDSEAIPSDMDDQIWEVSFDAPDACSPTAIATLLDPSLDSDAPSNPSSLGDEGPHNEVAVAPEVPPVQTLGMANMCILLMHTRWSKYRRWLLQRILAHVQKIQIARCSFVGWRPLSLTGMPSSAK